MKELLKLFCSFTKKMNPLFTVSHEYLSYPRSLISFAIYFLHSNVNKETHNVTDDSHYV